MKVDQMAVDFRLKKSHFRIKDVINHANIIGKIRLIINTRHRHMKASSSFSKASFQPTKHHGLAVLLISNLY